MVAAVGLDPNNIEVMVQRRGAPGAPDPSASISAPLIVHRARSKRKWAVDDVPLHASLHALRTTLQSLRADIDHALSAQRLPALEAISTAACATPPHGTLVVVCVLMGSGAVGGDRTVIFDGVCKHLDELNVLRIRASSTPGIRTLRDDLRNRVSEGPAVLALDDADAAPASLVRDVVYVAAKVAAEIRDETGEPRLALIAGCSTTADPVHSALGASEAAAVAPVVVEMPRAKSLLRTVVSEVLAKQTGGVLLARPVYQLIEHEFWERDCTLNMLLRTLRHIYTLHFLQQPLATSVAASYGKSLIGNGGEDVELEISDELCEQLRSATLSVQEVDGGECDDDELREKTAEWALDLKQWRVRRRTVECLFWDVLTKTDAYESGIDYRVGCERDSLRVQMFKAFLPGLGNDDGVRRQPVVKIVFEEIARAQKHQLQTYLNVAVEAMKAHRLKDAKVSETITKLQAIEAGLINAPSNVNSSLKAPSPAKSTPRAKGAAAAMGRRRAALICNAGAVQTTPSQQKLVSARRELAAVFDSLVNDVDSARMWPMYEGVLFERVSEVICITGGIGGAAEPRNTVLGALRDPSKYLGTLTQAQVPDTAIAYQILSEGGRLVNLYDWYNSFSAMRSSQIAAGDKDDDGDEETLVQARFARAVAELEFFGLLKHTKRKTDHVQRLVFE